MFLSELEEIGRLETRRRKRERREAFAQGEADPEDDELSGLDARAVSYAPDDLYQSRHYQSPRRVIERPKPEVKPVPVDEALELRRYNEARAENARVLRQFVRENAPPEPVRPPVKWDIPDLIAEDRERRRLVAAEVLARVEEQRAKLASGEWVMTRLGAVSRKFLEGFDS